MPTDLIGTVDYLQAPKVRAQGLREQGGGPGLSLPILPILFFDKPCGFCGCETLKSKAQELCEEGGTGGPQLSLPVPFFAPSLISPAVSVDIKHHERKLVRLFTGSNTDFDGFPV